MKLRQSADDGESLLEILIALAIMGICFSAILAAVGTAVRTSGINEQQADGSKYARQAAEIVKSAPWQCTPYTVPQPAGWTITAEPDTFWKGPTETTCAAGNVQRVVVTVTPPDSRASAPRTLDVFKRQS
ncbi:MAG TPA: hypothetical protein VNU26_09475 [Mycobacteriales bacterium]|nr:hypothetical protein [Mycobacteriales bacterium]